MKRSFFEAVAVLVGTTIGAGVLSIPYVVAKAGFFTGLAVIIAVGFLILVLNLYFGEVVSRTKGRHELVGYAGRYLGKTGKRLMTSSFLIGTYGALVAYLIGVSSSLNALLGLNKVVAMLVFFAVASALVYKGLKTVGKWELKMSAVVLLIIIFIFFASLSRFNPANFTGFDLSSIFVPYGAIFFAFIGAAAIPEMRGILEHDRKSLKRAVFIGSMVPMVAYLLFTVGVIAVTGIRSTEIATIGLGKVLGGYMLVIGNLFAILAMSTSFLALGLALIWTYNYDYNFRKLPSWALTVFPPLTLAISGLTGFVQVISISGAIAGGIDGILIVLMHRRAKKLGEVAPAYVIKDRWYISVLLCLLFLGGIIYTITNLF